MHFIETLLTGLLGWRFFAMFGVEYVLLIGSSERKVRRAYRLGNKLYAHPYLPETRCELRPGGETVGQCFIKGWEPITKGITDFYNKNKQYSTKSASKYSKKASKDGKQIGSLVE